MSGKQDEFGDPAKNSYFGTYSPARQMTQRKQNHEETAQQYERSKIVPLIGQAENPGLNKPRNGTEAKLPHGHVFSYLGHMWGR